MEGRRCRIYTPHPQRRFGLRPLRMFCDVRGRRGGRDGVSVRDISGDGEGGGGGREMGGCVYVLGFLCLMGMDKGVFIPLSYRTGRGEADNDGDAALRWR